MTLKRHKNKKKTVKIASLKSETMGKLIKRVPDSALRTDVEWFGKPRDVDKRSQSLAW